LRFIKSDFVDFLGLFKLNEKYITVTAKANRVTQKSPS
jgi:nicotinate phosphoribosyltransferase